MQLYNFLRDKNKHSVIVFKKKKTKPNLTLQLSAYKDIPLLPVPLSSIPVVTQTNASK